MSDQIERRGQRQCGWRVRGLLVLAVMVVLGSGPSAHATKDPFDWAFVTLDYARKDKVLQLRRFCERVHGLAGKARQDDMIVKFFALSREYHQLDRQGSAPDEIKAKVSEFRRVLDAYYIENYIAFYDILFVDRKGDIFYTIRKEPDYRKNIFDESHANTPLGRCLKKDPQDEVFIEFHHYDASGEAAAFFVEPVRVDGEHLGWLVLQCAVNKINWLFSGDEEMGETGEVFVVNRDGYMLTESNFEGDSTILRKHLDDRNIQAKFAAGQGHLNVTDYRGFPVMTSFEVFEFLGTKWLVVAKVDEAQVTTEHFTQHRRYFDEAIVGYLKGRREQAAGRDPVTSARKVLRVDIDEFVRANHGEMLKTVGVATCTGLVVGYPGKFGYLAHLSPLDKAYGGQTTNLVGQIVKKIKTYDIYRYERQRVRFVIVARHLDSLPGIIDKLIDEGFLLSQISMLYCPGSERAEIAYDYSEDRLSVEWTRPAGSPGKIIQEGHDAHNLGEIVRGLVASGERPQ